jgi:hypothetical protein
MSSPAAQLEGSRKNNRLVPLPPPVGGLNALNELASMSVRDAVIMENWLPCPDKLQMRLGAANHVTGFTQPVRGLWSYNGPTGVNKLFATTNNGIFDATTPGAVGAAVSALTNGYTTSTLLSTGASTYILIANGTDNVSLFDGTTWTTPAAFGAINTNTIFAVETYKQRIFALKNSSLDLLYLPPNAIAGAATAYPLGALFRKGGYLAALATWTVDSGTGPDDMLVVASSEGEVAVFSGNDPSSTTTWALKGVYYIGKPLGRNALYKYGGEVLFLCESGLYPISTALQTASVDRTISISTKVSPLVAAYAQAYSAQIGWQMVNAPDVPMLILNVPGTSVGTQLVMHSQSKAWTVFTGWTANCWARMGSSLYYGSTDKVVAAWTGSADFGNNITATVLTAYNSLQKGNNKTVRMIRPTFTSTGPFSYSLGLSNDFNTLDNTLNQIVAQGLTGSLWGTGLWGTAVWSSSSSLLREWQTVPDIEGVYKAIYCQVVSKTARVSFQSVDLLVVDHGAF